MTGRQIRLSTVCLPLAHYIYFRVQRRERHRKKKVRPRNSSSIMKAIQQPVSPSPRRTPRM